MKTIRVYPTGTVHKIEFGDVLYAIPNKEVYEMTASKMDHDPYLYLEIDPKDCWLEKIAIDKSTGFSSQGGFYCNIDELNSFLSEV